MNLLQPISPAPIGVFDSGYGGLTILRQMQRLLPEYDYLYLGDNARAPYGGRSFDLVYRFTLQAVEELFRRGWRLVILACNTASAKALRTIQTNDLPRIDPTRRVLGVIRPTVEAIGKITRTRSVGILGTRGTVSSHSYDMEIAKLHGDIRVSSHACPMWCPLVENNEADGPGADYFVDKDIRALLSLDPRIDTLVLGCTHYPLLLNKIKKFTPEGITIVTQGEIVAESLRDYLDRHTDIKHSCSQSGTTRYLTTESPDTFAAIAQSFLGRQVSASRISL